MDLSNCKWVDAGRNLIVTGASGAGKSWIACALGVAACNAFKTVRYVRLPEMLDELCVAKDEAWAKMNSNPVWYQQSANVGTAGQQSWYRR